MADSYLSYCCGTSAVALLCRDPRQAPPHSALIEHHTNTYFIYVTFVILFDYFLYIFMRELNQPLLMFKL